MICWEWTPTSSTLYLPDTAGSLASDRHFAYCLPEYWFEKHREILRHDPRGVAKVIRALCYLRDSAKGDRAEIERELAYFRKHRHRMRYHALKEEGVAIGSGVVEAACSWWYSA